MSQTLIDHQFTFTEADFASTSGNWEVHTADSLTVPAGEMWYVEEIWGNLLAFAGGSAKRVLISAHVHESDRFASASGNSQDTAMFHPESGDGGSARLDTDAAWGVNTPKRQQMDFYAHPGQEIAISRWYDDAGGTTNVEADVRFNIRKVP